MEFKFFKIDKLPDIFPHENIFICSNDKMIKMKCPCGCNRLILLNNDSNKKPYFNIEEKSIVGPSLIITLGCNTVFSITNGKLKLHYT